MILGRVLQLDFFFVASVALLLILDKCNKMETGDLLSLESKRASSALLEPNVKRFSGATCSTCRIMTNHAL